MYLYILSILFARVSSTQDSPLLSQQSQENYYESLISEGVESLWHYSTPSVSMDMFNSIIYDPKVIGWSLSKYIDDTSLDSLRSQVTQSFFRLEKELYQGSKPSLVDSINMSKLHADSSELYTIWLFFGRVFSPWTSQIRPYIETENLIILNNSRLIERDKYLHYFIEQEDFIFTQYLNFWQKYGEIEQIKITDIEDVHFLLHAVNQFTTLIFSDWYILRWFYEISDTVSPCKQIPSISRRNIKDTFCIPNLYSIHKVLKYVYNEYFEDYIGTNKSIPLPSFDSRDLYGSFEDYIHRGEEIFDYVVTLFSRIDYILIVLEEMIKNGRDIGHFQRDIDTHSAMPKKVTYHRIVEDSFLNKVVSKFKKTEMNYHIVPNSLFYRLAFGPIIIDTPDLRDDSDILRLLKYGNYFENNVNLNNINYTIKYPNDMDISNEITPAESWEFKLSWKVNSVLHRNSDISSHVAFTHYRGIRDKLKIFKNFYTESHKTYRYRLYEIIDDINGGYERVINEILSGILNEILEGITEGYRSGEIPQFTDNKSSKDLSDKSRTDMSDKSRIDMSDKSRIDMSYKSRIDMSDQSRKSPGTVKSSIDELQIDQFLTENLYRLKLFIDENKHLYSTYIAQNIHIYIQYFKEYYNNILCGNMQFQYDIFNFVLNFENSEFQEYIGQVYSTDDPDEFLNSIFENSNIFKSCVNIVSLYSNLKVNFDELEDLYKNYKSIKLHYDDYLYRQVFKIQEETSYLLQSDFDLFNIVFSKDEITEYYDSIKNEKNDEKFRKVDKIEKLKKIDKFKEIDEKIPLPENNDFSQKLKAIFSIGEQSFLPGRLSLYSCSVLSKIAIHIHSGYEFLHSVTNDPSLLFRREYPNVSMLKMFEIFYRCIPLLQSHPNYKTSSLFDIVLDLLRKFDDNLHSLKGDDMLSILQGKMRLSDTFNIEDGFLFESLSPWYVDIDNVLVHVYEHGEDFEEIEVFNVEDVDSEDEELKKNEEGNLTRIENTFDDELHEDPSKVLKNSLDISKIIPIDLTSIQESSSPSSDLSNQVKPPMYWPFNLVKPSANEFLNYLIRKDNMSITSISSLIRDDGLLLPFSNLRLSYSFDKRVEGQGGNAWLLFKDLFYLVNRSKSNIENFINLVSDFPRLNDYTNNMELLPTLFRHTYSLYNSGIVTENDLVSPIFLYRTIGSDLPKISFLDQKYLDVLVRRDPPVDRFDFSLPKIKKKKHKKPPYLHVEFNGKKSSSNYYENLHISDMVTSKFKQILIFDEKIRNRTNTNIWSYSTEKSINHLRFGEKSKENNFKIVNFLSNTSINSIVPIRDCFKEVEFSEDSILFFKDTLSAQKAIQEYIRLFWHLKQDSAIYQDEYYGKMNLKNFSEQKQKSLSNFYQCPNISLKTHVGNTSWNLNQIFPYVDLIDNIEVDSHLVGKWLNIFTNSKLGKICLPLVLPFIIFRSFS